MRIRGIGRLRQAAHSLRKRFAARALILQYHRVIELASDPYLLSVTPQHFAEHLKILQKHGYPMRLQQFSQALWDGNLPRRAIVMTFDDGYDDSLYTAKPLLERYDIPATVFVVSGYVGHKREFWWDELDRLLLQPRQLPQTLRLRVNGNLYQWELGDATDYSQDDYQRHRRWNYGQKDDPTPRHRLFRSLYQLLHSLSKEERWSVLGELLAWAGAESTVRSTHRTLSAEGVVHLAAGKLVEVGAHTVTHPVLSTLPVVAQRDEIQRSKTVLEEILGCPVKSFSYPHGLQSHYTVETVTVVREAGYTCACSSFTGAVWRHTDRFQLPRVQVRDWDGEAFESRLQEWFRG